MDLNQLYGTIQEMQEFAGYDVVFMDENGTLYDIEKIEFDKDAGKVVIAGELSDDN